MNHLRFTAVSLVLTLPLTAVALGPESSVALVAPAQKYDRATIGQMVELNGSSFQANFAEWACSFLTRKHIANWNVSGGECKFIKFLSTPKHGTLTPTDKPGEFAFEPTSLGKEIVRFVVENTVNGKRAIVSLHITIVKPEA